MKELILIVVMFVFGDVTDQANNMTQYIPYDKLSECMKDKRSIESGRGTNILQVSGDTKGKKAKCGLKIIEMEDGKVKNMYNDPDEVPAGSTIVKGNTSDVPVSEMLNWNMAKKEKFKKKIVLSQ
tara:strand:- start:62 stop:436 length:375 start_codon:yes stop_codon:yes gene_type:complete